MCNWGGGVEKACSRGSDGLKMVDKETGGSPKFIE
jgi:hypothetical protein